MTEKLTHFIDGQHVEGQSGNFQDVFNPAKGEAHTQVPLASSDEVKAAIASAHAAFPAWSATPPAKRASIMYKFRELLYAHQDEIAELVSKEHGKTVPDAKGELGRGIEVVEFACGIAHALKGDFSESVASRIDTHTIRQPLGVVAGITPFNFPTMVPMWMFPVAIATGNTFVLKPSERDPSSTIRLVELLHEAGLPPGVMNLVNGGKEAVDELLSNPDVKAVSFVGSTGVGEYIYTEGCKHGKRVQALCGAKNHMIVMPDADMDKAVDALIGAAYGSAGERCMAISVAVAVGDEVADELVEKLVPRIKALKVAPYTDEAAELGPVVTKDAKERIEGYIQSGVDQGATLVVDGRDVSIDGHENGYFLGGSLFDNVTADMDIYKDEIFGPVLVIVRAESYEAGLKLVNDHEYGNGAAIFTRDGDAAHDFTHRVQAGMVGVNVPIPVPVAYHSFGGWKRSMFGDHDIHGMEGLRFYTKPKAITTRWPSGIKEGALFHFKAGKDH
ncbi:MAG: CoA-acylating methylmalonate-semialdehyde dehydrogenase [Gammaproteobacteria bacterium]|nr:CoA-acylating methylmalonate-semialdehyde dehydrogenase [Gammaproteobacteria bacterium]